MPRTPWPGSRPQLRNLSSGRCAVESAQGPACAFAAGAATTHRNDFVPVGGGSGQTLDRLRSRLRIGLHREVEATSPTAPLRHGVAQAFCSALPVSCAGLPQGTPWAFFAARVLEAADEATLLARMLSRERTGQRVVLLIRVGGGAFGNAAPWIDAAIARALDAAHGSGLDLRLVARAHLFVPACFSTLEAYDITVQEIII